MVWEFNTTAMFRLTGWCNGMLRGSYRPGGVPCKGAFAMDPNRLLLAVTFQESELTQHRI